MSFKLPKSLDFNQNPIDTELKTISKLIKDTMKECKPNSNKSEKELQDSFRKAYDQLNELKSNNELSKTQIKKIDDNLLKISKYIIF
jgi:hypothetical protein